MKSYIQQKTFVSACGRREIHAIVTPDCADTFDSQLQAVHAAVKSLANSAMRPVMVRYFLTDPSNQARAVGALSHDCAVSVIGQPPLGGSKVAAWVWLQEGLESVSPVSDRMWAVKHGVYTTLIQTMACEPGLTSATATRAMLGDLALKLSDMNGSLLDNCLRTWLFVRDVDVNYSGAVTGRNELFALNGLTTDTHFIASTGINGTHADPTVSVVMDSLSHLGIAPAQVRQLEARTHLNPTSEYGVAFERATAIDFGDRRHVYVSGTASINNKGEIVFPGDIRRQTGRMIENVGALLAEADCGFGDVCHLLVYLRDVADRQVVEQIFAERFPDIPHVILLAPVCRPGWLIEMECMAFKSISTPHAAY